jgi:hypothetical protein
MNRKELIKKFINEGFSVSTLSNFTDKQLLKLNERFANKVNIVEQDATNTQPLQISKKDTKNIEQAKRENKKFITYEEEEIQYDEIDEVESEFISKKDLNEMINKKLFKESKNLSKPFDGGVKKTKSKTTKSVFKNEKSLKKDVEKVTAEKDKPVKKDDVKAKPVKKDVTKNKKAPKVILPTKGKSIIETKK